MDGFEIIDEKSISQELQFEGKTIKRVYSIDIIDSKFDFENSTDTTETAKNWFEKESKTLNRYLEEVK